MSRHHKKHEWSPYSSDIQRFSIYPRIQTRNDAELRVGSVVQLSISDIDEKGRGVATLNGKTIIVYNASLGAKVKAKIVKVLGDKAFAEVVETLKEVDVDY